LTELTICVPLRFFRVRFCEPGPPHKTPPTDSPPYPNTQPPPPPAVAAHIQRVKVVDLDVVPPVIAVPGPKLRVWLETDQIARLHEGFAQAELIVAVVAREVGVRCRVVGVGLNHHFRLHPRLVAAAPWIQPVVHKDE